MTVQVKGPQFREPITESEYWIYQWVGDVPGEQVILVRNGGSVELWHRNDSHAGYTIDIDGIGYEFITELPGKGVKLSTLLSWFNRR